MQDTAATIAHELLISKEGCFSAEEAKARGLSAAVLKRLCGEGVIAPFVPGLFSGPQGQGDFLSAIRRRQPRALFSHDTAMLLHRPTHRYTPARIHVTLPKTKRFPKWMSGEICPHHSAEDVHRMGAIKLATDYGQLVPLYDYERTLCDLCGEDQQGWSRARLWAVCEFVNWAHIDTRKLDDYAERLGKLPAVRTFITLNRLLAERLMKGAAAGNKRFCLD